jgi:hypothetical protein
MLNVHQGDWRFAEGFPQRRTSVASKLTTQSADSQEMARHS